MKRIVNIAIAIGVSSALYGQSTTNAPIYKISTVAGIPSIGDGGPGNGAVLIQPDAVVFDSAGNMFIADSAAHRVRRVDAVTGIITTVAGTGSPNYSATEDGKPAVNARLNTPVALAFDPAGNLYIADQNNHRIRKVDLNGIITTVAGEAGIPNSSGVPQNVNGGTTNGYAGDNLKATVAHLNSPRGLAFDPAGNMYIADTANNRVRKVDTKGIITTLAGTGVAGWSGDGGLAIQARLNAPEGVLADVNGNVFIADTANQRVRLVSSTGIITTVAGTCLNLFTRNAATGQSVPVVCTTGTAGFASAATIGQQTGGSVSNLFTGGDLSPATSSTLNNPRALALDVNGNLYVADQTNNRIRSVNSTGVITTLAGGGTSASDGVQAARATLNTPRAVTVDPNGRVVFADSLNGKIKAVDPVTGTIQTLVGQTSFSGDGGLATGARLSNPRGVAVDAAGNIYISDTGNNRVRKITGGVITTIAGTGAAGFSGDLSATLLTAPATSAQLNQPNCLAATSGGLVYFADKGNNRVRRIDLDGTISTVAGRARTAAETAAGAPTISGDLGAGINAQLNSPTCVALDPTGSYLAVADTNNHAIRLITLSTNLITTPAGNGTSGSSGDGDQSIYALLNAPQGVNIDPFGNIFIADTGNSLVREILASTGVIQTVAGISGSASNNGDSADYRTGRFNATIMTPAVATRLNLPQGVATDSAGNIFIADTGSNEVRRINAAQTYLQCIAGCGIFPAEVNATTATVLNPTLTFPGVDGDAANKVIIFQPVGITVDPAGNVYVTDREGLIRQLSPTTTPAPPPTS